MLCPVRKNKDGSPEEPTDFELNAVRNDANGLKDRRVRLSSVSWCMRFLSERVAKDANEQDYFADLKTADEVSSADTHNNRIENSDRAD